VVDLLLKPEVPFEELLARSQEALVGDTPVRVVSLDDLITLKRHAGGRRIWQTLRSWKPSATEREVADMADKREVTSREEQAAHWDSSDQSLLSATLMATPTRRIAWLEEALQLAHAIGALKPRRMLTREE